MARKPTYEQLEQRVKELEKKSLEYKEAQEAIHQYEERYRVLVESLLDAVYEFDSEGKFLYVNEAATHMFGYSEDEILGGLRVEDTIAEEDKAASRKAIADILKGSTTAGERTFIRKDGTRFPGEVHSGPLYRGKDVVGVRGILRDITKSRRAQEEIRKLSSAIEQSIDGIAIGDLEPRLSYVNKAFARMHGYSPGEMIGMKVGHLPSDEQVGEYGIAVDQIMTRGSWTGEIDHIRKDGTAFPTYITATLLKDDKGAPIGVIAVCRDITDRRRAEEELRIKDSAIRSSINAIALADLEGSLLYVNDSFLKQWGYDGEQEVLERSAVEFWQGEETASAVIGALRERNGWVGQLVAMKKGGSLFDVQVSASMVAHDSGRPICMMASFVDISERNRIEQALRQREAELEIKTKSLEEVNTALRVLLKRRDEDKTELEEKVLSNVKELVVPFLEKVKQSPLDPKQLAYMHMAESNLNDIISPFLRDLSTKFVNLTPTEIRVAHLITEGKTTKEIGGLLALSPRTIETHRRNMRKKLGIAKKKGNLRSHLLSFR